MSKNDFQPPCDECGGRCCKYVAIEIDKPTTKTDYDHIRWYLVHENVNVFVDHDNKWHIEFRTPCEFQDENNRCSIYSKRPKICREHCDEEGSCEFYDTPYSMYFSEAREFEKYLERKGKDWKFKNH